MSRFDNDYAQLLEAVIARTLREHKSAFPAEVTRYDATKQLVDVRPLVADWFPGDEDVEQVYLPIITNVPVLFPGAGDFRVTFPVAVGDVMQVLIQDRSIDAWLDQGGRQTPTDTRRHHLADAVAIPGLHDNKHPWTGASTSGMTLGKDGGTQITIKAGEIDIGGSSDAVAVASKVDARLNDLKTAISGWTPVANDGGAALKTALVTWLSGTAATGSSVAKVAA